MGDREDVTGREAILEVAEVDGARIADAIKSSGFVSVPREPTAHMIEKAYGTAHEENALVVWRSVIKVSGMTTATTGENQDLPGRGCPAYEIPEIY
jgi:hypothetical protein